MSSPEDGRSTPEPAPNATSGGEQPNPWAYANSASTPPSADPARADSNADSPVGSNVGSNSGSNAGSSSAGTEPGSSRATTRLPTADSTSSDAATDDKPADSAPTWTSNETQDFPAYQPQSYPTYPPVHSPTTELPAVADGPPPSTAAAYAGTGGGAAGGSGAAAGWSGAVAPGGASAGYGSFSAGTDKPARRGGAGFAGAVGFIGLCGAAAGAFALPVQQFANSQNTYFGTYRDLAVHKLVSSGANDHSISIVGGHIATDWWRYGVFAALGGLAVLLLVQICIPVLRRVAGLLLFLGGLAAAAGFLLGAHQTNDYSSVSRGQNLHRISWHHLAYGFWVAVAGCAVVALGGLIAGLQSTRK